MNSYRSQDGPIDVLLVENTPGDARLTKNALHECAIHVEITLVPDGDEALDYLHQRDEYTAASLPNLVVLAEDLPGMDSFDVLDAIKGNSNLSVLPVVILSRSKADEDVRKAYEKHVNAYLSKPTEPDEFTEWAHSFANFWLQVAKLPPSDM